MDWADASDEELEDRPDLAIVGVEASPEFVEALAELLVSSISISLLFSTRLVALCTSGR
jgi:hypothetical protein